MDTANISFNPFDLYAPDGYQGSTGCSRPRIISSLRFRQRSRTSLRSVSTGLQFTVGPTSLFCSGHLSAAWVHVSFVTCRSVDRAFPAILIDRT